MSEWISVEERVPEVSQDHASNSEDVLILDNDGRMYVGHMTFYSATGYRTQSETKWSANETGCGCCSENLHPTHWMNLPKLPEDKE